MNGLKRGIYVLPSLFTTLNLAAGFLCVIWSIDNNFTPAAWAIIFAILSDVVDGRIARWTKTTSRFGVEYDSLADLISFGMAPAILIYQVVLHTMNKPGIAIALFFVVAAAMRLARFNVKTQDGESTPHFVGLPSPAAAGIIASFVLSYQLFVMDGITAKTIPLLMNKMPFFFKMIAPTVMLLSFLMISNVPYIHFKKFKLSRPKSFQLLIFIVIGAVLVVTYPQNTIFILFLIYLLSGITEYIWRYWVIRKSLLRAIRLRKQAGQADTSLDTQNKH